MAKSKNLKCLSKKYNEEWLAKYVLLMCVEKEG